MSAKETQEKAGNQDNKQDKATKILIIVFALVIIVMAVVIVILLTKKPAEEETERRNVVVNPQNAEEVAQQMLEHATNFTPPGYFTVNMATEWHFEKGDAVSRDARVDNLETNTNDVYFDLFLESDESTPIYRSPIIPRGGYLEQIVLDTVLEQGVYDCVMIYHLVDEEQNTISMLRVTVTVYIEA